MKFKPSFTLILLASLLAALLGLARVPSAHAQTTITVSICDESHLDAAISKANTDNAFDTIKFSCGGDIKLTSTLQITGNMTLDGSGQSVTLDGQNQVQVLSVGGVTFTLNALTVAHGLASSNFGGGLFNAGTVNITNSTFANNSAPGGGGLYNSHGSVTIITNSTFANNSGGGLLNAGTVNITNSTFANNSDNGGGGLYNSFGSVSITNSTFAANNGASSPGGGLFNDGGSVTITNSTFANNSAFEGGGLFNNDSVSISNSTFANNAADFFGGGIENVGGLFNNDSVSISNSTFANNAAGHVGGGLFNDSGSVTIGGSIVANNSAFLGDANCRGGISDQGYNLESGTDCGFTRTGDLQNTDPKLDPTGLQSNGGPTQTIALEPDSPAIDQIPKSSCPATDQRGVSRPQGPTSCDIGAFELKATEGITELIAIVNSFGLSMGLQTSLDAKLEDALTAVNAGQTATACSDLTDFINQVKAKTGKGISPSQAQQLIKAATNIQGVLGC